MANKAKREKNYKNRIFKNIIKIVYEYRFLKQVLVLQSAEREVKPGFAQLRSVSKLHSQVPKLLPNVSKLLRNQFQISSSPLIYSYSYLFFWIEILTKVFDRKH